MGNQLPFQAEALMVQIKNEFPTWGAPKIRERLLAKYPEIKNPAKSTVHAVLERMISNFWSDAHLIPARPHPQ